MITESIIPYKLFHFTTYNIYVSIKVIFVMSLPLPLEVQAMEARSPTDHGQMSPVGSLGLPFGPDLRGSDSGHILHLLLVQPPACGFWLFHACVAKRCAAAPPFASRSEIWPVLRFEPVGDVDSSLSQCRTTADTDHSDLLLHPGPLHHCAHAFILRPTDDVGALNKRWADSQRS